MPVPVRGGLQGLDEVLRRFAGIEKVFRAATRKGINEATKLVLSAAKANVPRRTGSLKKSLGRKVVALKGDRKGYIGIVGPRKDISEKERGRLQREFEQGKRKRPPGGPKFRKVVKHKGREILVNPVKYAHLVEYGTKPSIAKGKVLSDGETVFGKRTKGSAPRPFLRPAWEGNKAACELVILAELRDALKQAGR
jgi:HK97 gp10 family phage protein